MLSSPTARVSTAVQLPASAAMPAAVPRAEAADLLPASAQDVATALMAVLGSMGLGPAHERDADDFVRRVEETAAILASAGWTLAQIREAARALAMSPELDDKIRYGRPVTAADFERVRRSGLEMTTERVRLDGVVRERVVVTRTGFALKVDALKLYTAAEAYGIWQAAGEPGTFADGVPLPLEPEALSSHDDAMFTAVEIPGVGRRFRFKQR